MFQVSGIANQFFFLAPSASRLYTPHNSPFLLDPLQQLFLFYPLVFLPFLLSFCLLLVLVLLSLSLSICFLSSLPFCCLYLLSLCLACVYRPVSLPSPFSFRLLLVLVHLPVSLSPIGSAQLLLVLVYLPVLQLLFARLLLFLICSCIWLPVSLSSPFLTWSVYFSSSFPLSALTISLFISSPQSAPFSASTSTLESTFLSSHLFTPRESCVVIFFCNLRIQLQQQGSLFWFRK